MSLVLLTASVAWAGGIPVGVGGLGTDPHLVFDGNANDPNGITLDIPPFWLDPNGPSLEKWINLDVTGGLKKGQVIWIMENITIVSPPATSTLPPLPLTDWHEEVHHPDFQWHPGTGTDPTIPFVPAPELWIHNRDLPGDPPGTGIHVRGDVGTVPSPDGTTHPNNAVWFEPIPPVFPEPNLPLDIWINKDLVYTGPDIPPSSDPRFIEVGLWEHATVPEPSTIVLAGTGLFGLLGYGWLKRRRGTNSGWQA